MDGKLSLGASMTYLAKIFENLTNLSDGPLEDKKSTLIADKDTEIAESLVTESSALQSHLLWLTDLLVA